MIECYDPNIQIGVHTIRLTFMQWGYAGHIAYEVGGNVRGADLLNADLLDYADTDDVGRLTENDCQFEWLEAEEIYQMILTNPDGEQLQVEGEPDEIKDMVVSIEFAKHEREAQ